MGTRTDFKVALRSYLKLGTFHISDVECLLQDIKDYLGYTEERTARKAIYGVPATMWLQRHDPYSRSSAVLMLCLFLLEQLEDSYG